MFILFHEVSISETLFHLRNGHNSINIQVSEAMRDLLGAFKATARCICRHLRTDIQVSAWEFRKQQEQLKKTQLADAIFSCTRHKNIE